MTSNDALRLITRKDYVEVEDVTFAYPDFVFYEGTYNPRYCPDTRLGHETLHTCPPSQRDECPTPKFWEDHCHAYQWLRESKEGDTQAFNNLCIYYKPRVSELIDKKYSYLEKDEAYSLGMEALLATLKKYDPSSFSVPLQAYIRLQLPRRMIDIIRENGWYNRTTADFYKRLNTVMEENPHFTERQAADALIGTPNKTKKLTRKRVEALMRDREMKSPLHLDYFSSNDSGYHVLPTAHDVEEIVLANEAADNAKKVIEVLTANYDAHDIELVIAYTSGGIVLTEWAEAHNMERNAASAQAQSLISKLKARAADLLNVSQATLAERDSERNQVKFLEAMHTGRITADGQYCINNR